ncbi:MAG TPA: hypothetical protein VGD14_04365 [bacterium]
MKKKMFFIILIIALAGIAILITNLDINQFENMYAIAFTYLSITIGFVVTSITIIASSGFSKVLYLKQHPTNNAKTLLHVLLDNFKATLILYAIPMILILVSPIIPWSGQIDYIRKLYNAILLVLILSTFPILLYQFKTMLKYIIQNVKNIYWTKKIKKVFDKTL